MKPAGTKPDNLTKMKKVASSVFVLACAISLWALTREECDSMFWSCRNAAQTTAQLNECYTQRTSCYEQVNEHYN